MLALKSRVMVLIGFFVTAQAATALAGLPAAKQSPLLFWTDFHGQRIMHSNLDGSNQEPFLELDYQPRGIDIDSVNGQVYWTGGGGVWRAELDGSDITPLSNGITLSGIAVNQERQELYWGDTAAPRGL